MNPASFPPSTEPTSPVPTAHRIARAILALGVVCVLLATAANYYTSPAALPQSPLEVHIPAGTSLRGATEILSDAGVVRSARMLELAIHTFYGNAPIRAGIYVFDTDVSLREVAQILISGEGNSPLVRLTIPEGLSVREIDPIVADTLAAVGPDEFAAEAKAHEGYLFPDTYFLDPDFDASSTIAFMRENFEAQIAPLRDTIEASGRTLEDIIIMASILEKEANDPESMDMVSGILWKRLDNDMRLQVDAPFAYALDIRLADITAEDLDVDTPYNTYRYDGLTPTPIGNPGLGAITAALTPTESPYWYYITADDGTFYYARTFDEHKQNIARYLR